MALSLIPSPEGVFGVDPGHSIPANVEHGSVYAESEQEIEKHKWIESQKAGYDLGEEAIRQWVLRHWPGFVRARWIEHLQGMRFWTELDSGDFGFLQQHFAHDRAMMDRLIERLKSGHENLHFILSIVEGDIPRDIFMAVLEKLHINSKRLKHKYDPYFC